MSTGPALGRVPFLAAGFVALGLGLWAGLARLGLAVGATVDLSRAHGPLMVVAFLSVVIGVERAVAVARPWAWAGPVLCAIGGVGGVVGLPTAPLAVLGLLVLVAVFVQLWRGEPALHIGLMLAAATVGAIGTGAWAAGLSLDRVMPLWAWFLVTTIAGERLELTRLTALPRTAQLGLVGLIGLALVGAGIAAGGFAPGARVFGFGLVGIAAWLVRFDVARRTLRTAGLPRFAATCLLLGYGWLAIAGVALVAWGPQVAGLRYDAQVHTIFVGFVFSMILGHAPIVFPAVLRVIVPFRHRAWVPLVVLHGALAVRVLGDVLLDASLRTAGGVAGVGAIVLFLVTTLSTMVPALRRA